MELICQESYNYLKEELDRCMSKRKALRDDSACAREEKTEEYLVNTAMEASKNDFIINEEKISKLNTILKNYNVSEVESDIIICGSIVKLNYLEDNEIITVRYVIDPSMENNIDIITENSAIGKQLKGKRAGDLVTYSIFDRIVACKILEVTND